MLRMLKQVRAASALVNPEEIRKRANRPVTVGLVASTAGGYEELEKFLVPLELPRTERLPLLARLNRAGDADAAHQVDLVIYGHGVVAADGSYTFDRNDPRAMVEAIVRENDSITLALARQFPAFRKTVVDRLIQEVARENAMFAVATALPNILPSIIEIPWAVGEFASDTAFLTVNQARLAFLIAAACGGEVGLMQQKAEILSIAGGAFGWRALARELVGKIPLGGGLIPKGAIAYAGTVLVGKSLAYYHHTRKHYTPVERETVYREAYEQGKEVTRTLREPQAE
jgi:hypothetical protein